MADPKWQEILIQAGRDKLTKQDIYDYYTNPKIQKHILNATGKNEVILRQSFTPENVVLRRKSETGEPIFLRGKSDLQTWAEKRLTEVHPTYGRKTDHLLVDLDPGEDVSWEKVQQTAKQVAQTLGADPRVTGVSAQFSGHRGFYIRGQLDRNMNVDAAREKVKDLLAPLVKQDKELTIGVKTDPMYQIRLDTTPLKYRGSVKAPYSLSAETGLVAAPVKVDDLTKVKPGDFTISHIMKQSSEIDQIKEAAEKKYRDRVEAFALTPDGKVIAGLYSGSAKNVAVPGGGIDPGETKNQAAKREFKEEAGIAIKNVRSLGVAPVLTAWSRKDKSYRGKDWQADIKKHPGGNRTHFVLADVDTAKAKKAPQDPTEFAKTLKARPIDDLIAIQRKAIQKHPDSDRLKQMRKRLEMLLKIKHTEKTAFEIDYEGLMRAADVIDDRIWMALWKKHQKEQQAKETAMGPPSYSMTPGQGPANYAAPPPFAEEPRSMFRKESEKKEFAPGIPLSRKIHDVPKVKNKAWTLAVQRHFADRAGKHFDLRLVDPKTHKAHSFALPKAELPKPGQMRLAVQQATHTEDYAMNFEGTIPKGTYGSGKVEMALKTPVDIIKSNANRIAFKTEKGDSYTMFRMKDKNWGIKNTTK